MSSPVQLTDLPVGNLALSNDPSAIMLMRTGLTDYQVAVEIIRTINIGAFEPIPGGFANPTDLLMIARNSANYNIRFSQVGFSKGTRMWFWQQTAPIGWSIIPNTTDRVLAVAPYSGETNGGTQGGTWQQPDHILTVEQIPPHVHTFHLYETIADSNSGFQGPRRARVDANTPRPPNTDFTGGGLPHNHGNVWRPLANIGIICNKDT